MMGGLKLRILHFQSVVIAGSDSDVAIPTRMRQVSKDCFTALAKTFDH